MGRLHQRTLWDRMTKNCVHAAVWRQGNPVTHRVPGGDPQKTWTSHVSTSLYSLGQRVFLLWESFVKEMEVSDSKEKEEKLQTLH